MNRAERRRFERDLKSPRTSGGRWIQVSSPAQKNYGRGWVNEMNVAFKDIGNNYVVMIREVQTDWGIVRHAFIRNADNTDIPWAEKQRIKNEVFGKESTAIEVFPKEADLVDAANAYHLWILPPDMKLPFGLKN
ncbi:hypothetical protein AAGS61_02870 [Lysinibacillus sp. KU-BSD001]|uniref:DUF7694 domain-containing protein n=1 Tax=Lysinibacillus sp. KU-BSD001 TaxID=3141328 RepID=UPI0036E4746A